SAIASTKEDGFFEISATIDNNREWAKSGILLMELLPFAKTEPPEQWHILDGSNLPVHHKFSPSQAQDYKSHLPSDVLDSKSSQGHWTKEGGYKVKKSVLQARKVSLKLGTFQEDNTGAEKIKYTGEVNAANTVVKLKEKRRRKAPYANAIRLVPYKREDEAEQIHLVMLLLAKGLQRRRVDAATKKEKLIVQFGNQGSWKLNQLRKLSFKEVKEELKETEKRTKKEEKDDEAKDDESTKKSGKRRKQMARKCMNTNVDSEDSDKVDEQEETNTGTETPINPVPVAMKTPSVATYKIIKQGEKGVYQIVREDGTDIVYINFGAMLKSISRDDLTELYRIVMNRYGVDGPEDKLEKGFWKCLRIMFEEPLSTDSIWSEIEQQKIVSWRYYDTSRVHCLNLESMDVYLLSDRKYPLSAEVCKTMLKMKLLDGKMNEDCYRLLKMMEKQAGIRK
ncbi:hypothetical protein Tco_1531447, partial [Tanacetum coccineum]